MMKKFIAVLVLMLQAGSASAFGWEDIKIWWNDTADYVTGWFADGQESADTSETLPANIAGKWGKLTGTITDALTLRDKQEELPDSAWFGEDKVSNGKRIDELLNQALEILSGGEAGNARIEAVKLRARLTELRTRLDALRNERINAPESTYMFWRDTKSKIDAKISDTEKEISRTESEMSGINARLNGELGKLGITLTDEQADILLNSVTGEDILNNTVVFENVKAVVTKLEELSRENTNTQEITKRYAGMYLVLNDILIHTQEELVRKMDGEYKPRLSDIMKEAEALRRDALSRSNNRSYTQSQRKSFAQNAKSNAATVQAAKLYGQLLEAQRLSLMNSIKALRLNRDLAENTYRTVRSSGELQGLIHSGLNAIDAVMRLSMPELKIFEGNALRAEFDEINRRLKR